MKKLPEDKKFKFMLYKLKLFSLAINLSYYYHTRVKPQEMF